jgi:uncharacterized Zn-binding protein involved in type VI secretion
MPAAARQGDAGLVHCTGYTIAGGSGNVRINGRPAARDGDSSTPHKKPGGKNCVVHTSTIQASRTVRVNGRPLACVGDRLSDCTSIAQGSSNVIVGR